MMLKPKSRPALRLLAAAALPAVGLSLLALSAPDVANALEAVSDAKVTNISAAVQAVDAVPMLDLPAEPDDKDKVVVVGVGAKKKSEAKEVTVVTYDRNNPKTVPADKMPLVVIDGKVSESTTDALNSIPTDAIASVTILKDEESKAKYAGYPAAANGVMLITTKATEQKGADKIYDAVEEPPQYPGSDAEMMKFIAANLKFPESAISDTTFTSGRTIVRFVVETDGSVGNEVKVVRSSGNEACDQEAQRVVKLLKFTPGRMAGKPVRVMYTIPLLFVKDKNKESETATK